MFGANSDLKSTVILNNKHQNFELLMFMEDSDLKGIYLIHTNIEKLEF